MNNRFTTTVKMLCAPASPYGLVLQGADGDLRGRLVSAANCSGSGQNRAKDDQKVHFTPLKALRSCAKTFENLQEMTARFDATSWQCGSCAFLGVKINGICVSANDGIDHWAAANRPVPGGARAGIGRYRCDNSVGIWGAILQNCRRWRTVLADAVGCKFLVLRHLEYGLWIGTVCAVVQWRAVRFRCAQIPRGARMGMTPEIHDVDVGLCERVS
jgi:hypothetical protein